MRLLAAVEAVAHAELDVVPWRMPAARLHCSAAVSRKTPRVAKYYDESLTAQGDLSVRAFQIQI